MNASSSRNNTRNAGTSAAVQSGADRVFITHPRVFSFSHRSLASLRHPALPTIAAQAETDLAKVKRQFQTKGERMAGMLTGAALAADEDRWRHVAFMLDSISEEDSIAQRRSTVLDAISVTRTCESVWGRFIPPSTGGMDRHAYLTIQAHLYHRLVGAPEPQVQTIFLSAAEADYALDADSDGLVSYGAFTSSMLEVADNWVGACDAEAYAAFLSENLAGSIVGLDPPKVTQRTVAGSSEEEWPAVVEALRNQAQRLEGASVVHPVRTVTGSTVYEKAPMAV